jgi:hypothetical protein
MLKFDTEWYKFDTEWYRMDTECMKYKQSCKIIDSPYYVFVARCIVVIVVSLIKIAASNENIECFREYFAVGYRAPAWP